MPRADRATEKEQGRERAKATRTPGHVVFLVCVSQMACDVGDHYKPAAAHHRCADAERQVSKASLSPPISHKAKAPPLLFYPTVNMLSGTQAAH